MTANSTERREFSFDGKGINGPDEYRSRIATFANAEMADKYGKRFEDALCPPATDYNGWTNYETWAVNLWLTNDQESDSYWRARVAELAATLPVTEDMLPYHVGDALKEEFEEASPLNDSCTVWADLLNAALSEVNWSEIAKHFLDDANEV